jgi:hypothetical protein
MKVRKKKKNEDDEDEEEFKKVTLLESFSISTYYDFMRDSLRLEPISISGRTLIFKYINLNFRLSLDPYAYDEFSGSRCNTFEWDASRPSSVHSLDDGSGTIINVVEKHEKRRLFRLESTSWDISCGLSLNKNFFTPKNKDKETEKTDESAVYGFKDWSMTLNYVFSYNMMDNRDYYRFMRMDTLLLKYTHNFNNTLNVSGRLPFTPKWAVGFQSGYDFSNKQFSYSTFTVERDLHCWTMSFSWSPFGISRHFMFLFQAKASILSDVKWNPERRYQDN